MDQSIIRISKVCCPASACTSSHPLLGSRFEINIQCQDTNFYGKELGDIQKNCDLCTLIPADSMQCAS